MSLLKSAMIKMARGKQQKALEHSRAFYDIAGFRPLASRREYSLQGDDKGQAEKRHHVVVRLIAAGDRGGERAHGHGIGGSCVHRRRTSSSTRPDGIGGTIGPATG